MHRSRGNSVGVWIAVGVVMAILTLYLLLVLRRSGISSIVQVTVILSLIPLLVFVD